MMTSCGRRIRSTPRLLVETLHDVVRARHRGAAGPDGLYVYVVSKDRKAEMRRQGRRDRGRTSR